MSRRIIALFLAVATGAFAADSQTLLTSGANVRLRAAASSDAAVVDMLPLGTRLARSGPDQAEGWIPVHVLREGGPQGWVEGYIVCYLERIDILLGEYLRREPGGRHIDEAVARILESVERFTREQPGSGLYFFDAKSECPELKGGIAALGSAAQGSQASQRNLLVEKLRGLSSLCP